MSNQDMNSSKQESMAQSLLAEKTSKRRFFKKAALGAAITTIPSHSVWAGRLISGNMSGNVSGWGDDCHLYAIWSHGKFKTPTNNGRILTPYHAYKWKDVFGLGRPPYSNVNPDTTLEDIINSNGTDAQLATMYINAKLHFQVGSGVYWPVVENGLFMSEEEYVQHLYDFGSGIGGSIGALIDEHHAGGTGLKNTCS